MNEIKSLLLENPRIMENILKKLGFHKVRVNNYKKEITCGNRENGKGFSIHIKLDESLKASDFKYGISGDFISFLIKKKGLKFIEAINLIKNELGIENINYSKKEKNGLFGGAYSNIKRPDKPQYLEILSEDELNPFINKYNLKFAKDGIKLETQEKFEIGFDINTQRITIPWRDYEGNLVGIMGRFNGECDDSERWLPIIPFNKRDLLYGYIHNYEHLQGCEFLYLGESEKFPLQLDSMGIYTALGIGRSSISMMQIKRMLSLQPKNIVYCLDEGLPLEIILKNVDATKKLCRYNNIKISYVYDENNMFLKKDSKNSPSDLGKVIFLELVNNYVKEVG